MIESIFLIQQNIEVHEEEEFNLFLFAILIMGLIIIGISIFIGILILLAIFGLIAVGALSGSIMIGIQRRSFTSGFKTFVILFSVASCTFLGGIGTWLLNKWMQWWTDEAAILIGICSGLLGGTAIGFLGAYIIRLLSTFLKEKLIQYKIIKEASANIG